MNYTFWYDYSNDEKIKSDCRKVVEADSLEEALFKFVDQFTGKEHFLVHTLNGIPFKQITMKQDEYIKIVNQHYGKKVL